MTPWYFHERVLPRRCLASLLSAAMTYGSSVVRAADMRPNILFLMADQHRFDIMGKEANTPELDSLAEQGVRFTSHYSSTPTCTPARAGLLTGLSPWRHGMLTQGEIAASYSQEFPRAMAAAGYSTAIIGKAHYGMHDHGFQEMFLYDGVQGEDDDYNRWFVENVAKTQPNWGEVNSWRHADWPYAESVHPTHWVGEKAAAYIKDVLPETLNQSKPFLLKVSFHRPHSPYDPPAFILNATPSPNKPSQRSLDGWDSVFKSSCKTDTKWKVCGEVDPLEEDLMRRSYRAAVAHVDQQISKIMGALRIIGQESNTVIIYTSDHGDHQGDHYLFRKGSPYEGSTHIPLIIRWPKSMRDNVAVRRGGTIHNPTELRDIFPTMLDIAGAWDNSMMPKFDGRPLTWLMRGDSARWRKWIDLEHAKYLLPAWSALTDGVMKFIYWPTTTSHLCLGNQIVPANKYQLFNLSADPGENTDLSRMPAYAAELDVWKKRLVEQYQLEERGGFWLRQGEATEHDGNCLFTPHYPGEAVPDCQFHRFHTVARSGKDLVCSPPAEGDSKVLTRDNYSSPLPQLRADVSFLQLRSKRI